MKSFQIGLLLFFAALLLWNPPLSYSDSSNSADQTLHVFIDTLKTMQFPIEDAGKHAGQVTQANAAVNLEAMGIRALGNHWEAMTADQQTEFMRLLWRLIENIAYPRSHSFFGGFPIEYSDPKAIDGGIEITTVVKQEDAALNAPIVYHLSDASGQWKIFDIFLDGVTITEDLKFQFDKIIEDSSFAGLLDRMRERLTKAEKENTKA